MLLQRLQSVSSGINLRSAFAPFAHKTTLGRRKNSRRRRFGAFSFGAALWYFMSAPRFFGRPLYRLARLLQKLKLVWWRSNHFPVTCYFRFGVKLLSILILRKITGFSPYLTMPPEEKASCDRHKPKENNFHVTTRP